MIQSFCNTDRGETSLDKSKEDLIYQSIEKEEEKPADRRISDTKVVGNFLNNERPKTTLVPKTKQITARLLSPQAISTTKKPNNGIMNSSVSVIKGDQKKSNLVYQAIMDSKAEAEVSGYFKLSYL